jgi:putative transposase
LDEFIIMPNHLHGILIINDNDNYFDVGARRCLAPCNANAENRAPHRPVPFRVVAPTTLKSNSLGSIIGQFKSIVTKQINRIRNHPGMPAWQRNYYEHVIRNEKDLNQIRQYIKDNPLQWELDEENPQNINDL